MVGATLVASRLALACDAPFIATPFHDARASNFASGQRNYRLNTASATSCHGDIALCIQPTTTPGTSCSTASARKTIETF